MGVTALATLATSGENVKLSLPLRLSSPDLGDCDQDGAPGQLRRLAPMLVAWLACVLLAAQAKPAAATDQPAAEDGVDRQQDWALHAQTTVVYQYHPAFASPYQGTNSLTPSAEGKETFDLTLY